MNENYSTEKYNVAQIVKISSSRMVLDSSYVFKKQIKFLGIVIRNEGIYDRDSLCYVKMPANHVMLDGAIYRLPFVKTIYNGGIISKKYFPTNEQADAYLKDITTSYGKWIG